MDKIEFENGFSEDSKAIITKIIEMRMLETDKEKQNIPTKDVGVGTLSDSALSSLVSKLESDIPKLDMDDILKDTINELGCKKELSKSTQQIHAEIKETSEKISNSQKTRPDFDINYQNLMKKLKTKINYSFYDKLKSYFNPEKIFTPKNIKLAKQDNFHVIMNECETDGEAIEFSTEPDCVGFGKNDEEILSEIVCEKKFSMLGEIYDNPTAKFKLNPNGYIKNVSDYTIMLPCEFALKPFHLMDLNSIFKIDQKTIDSFKKNNEFFLEHIKLGNIKPCSQEDVDHLNKYIKSKEFIPSEERGLVNMLKIYETIISLIRSAGLQSSYLSAIKDQFPTISYSEIDVMDKIRTASLVVANNREEHTRPRKESASLPSFRRGEKGKITRIQTEDNC